MEEFLKMSKITHEWDRDEMYSCDILILKKKSGKFTIDEIVNYLRDEIRTDRKFAFYIDMSELKTMPQEIWEKKENSVSLWEVHGTYEESEENPFEEGEE